MASNVAVGLIRPPRVFFYEIDSTDKNDFTDLYYCAEKQLQYYSIYKTKHGYHIIGYPYTKKAWKHFSFYHESDFTIKLKPRWQNRNPQVLRISEKWDLKTGKVVSPAPKLVCGNFFLEGIMKYKVMYYAK